MADSQDADIDEIMGQEDLELDELDNESNEEGKQEEKPEEKSDAEPEEKKEEPPKEGDSSGESKEDEEAPKETPEVKSEEKPEEKKEESKPLTKEDIQAAFREARESDQASAKQIESLTNEVIEKYYPEGLSNVLIDDRTGKELKTPQDVVDASDGKLSIEEASQWLMNEQYKLDQNVNKIKDDARNIAETNANFQTGIERVLSKYGPVFKAFEKHGVQEKVYKAYMKQVKMDNQRDLVLSAPDIEDFYDLVMEPYLIAFGNMQTQQASSSPPAEKPADKPSIPDSKPSIDDRLDESGDGVGGSDNEADPNDANDSLNKLFEE